MPAQRSNLTKLALFARPTCSSYASAFGDEGKGVNDGQRIRNLMSDQVYYVLDIFGIWRCYDVMQEPCVSSCVAKYDLLENLFSRVTS